MRRPGPHPTATVKSRMLRRLRYAVRRAAMAARRRGWIAPKPASGAPAGLTRHWERIMPALLECGNTSVGNSVRLICDGDECMEAIWHAIEHAHQEIWFEMYTIEPDRVGNRTIEELTRAAERGCKVTLLYDAVGSSRLPQSMLVPLHQAGAQIAVFNPLRPRVAALTPGLLLRRDHRKIIIVDGQIGFCGGMNMSEDYAGATYGNGRFHDCLVMVNGPCVHDLAAVLASSWRMVKEERKPLPRRGGVAGPTLVQVQASRGALGRRSIQRALRLTIRNAVSHCSITTPYFIPPLRLVRAIRKAAQRGVEVRILTAGLSDVPVVRLAAQHVYGSLLRDGVRIYEMFSSTLHAKTMTIDSLYSTVGSFNLDMWSDKRNLEVNIAMIDSQVAGEVQANFQSNIENATEVTLDTWQKRPFWRRLLHWCAYQVLRV